MVFSSGRGGLRLQSINKNGYIKISNSKQKDTRYQGEFEIRLSNAAQGDKKSLLSINLIDLEAYLAGLVNKEIHSSYPREAIKAQVIAARSYALAVAADRRKRGLSYDLLNTEADQVYQGIDYEDEKSWKMVRETSGQVLYHQGQILKAYYHSSSGGHSELPENVWGDSKKDEGAYSARATPWEDRSSQWAVQLSPALGERWPDVGRLKEIKVLSVTEGKRVRSLLLTGERGHKVINGAEFRAMLGNGWVKSTLFEVFPMEEKKSWKLVGFGFGHGVGLSQKGARTLAKMGAKMEKILSHYYPYAQIGALPVADAIPVLGSR